MKLNFKNIVITATLVVTVFIAYGISEKVFAYDWSGSGSSCGDCGGSGGEGGGGGEGNVIPTANPRVTAVCVDREYGKAKVTVNIDLTNQSLWIDGVDYGGISNSKTITLDHNRSYTGQIKGTFNIVVANFSFSTPNCPPPPVIEPLVCNYLTATPNILPAGGGTVRVSWSVEGSSSRTITKNGVSIGRIGTPVGYGDHPVTEDSTFVLTAVGANGESINCTAEVIVQKTPPQNPAAKCESFTVNGSRNIVVPSNGANVTLAWDTTNATSVSIDNGVGTVAADGSTSVFVNSNRTYTLTAIGTGGNESCTVSITKENQQVDAPRCDYFRVSDDEVEEGDDVTLSWETTNATSVSINHGIGTVSADGTRTVEINDDITYILTVSNASGTNTCTVRVEVEEEEEERERTPRCELDISKSRVSRGERVTLSWETKNVDDIVIKDDRGNTIFDTDDYSSSQRKRYFDGEIDIVINQSTEFRMTARGVDGGSRTCKVDVDVDEIAVYEKRDQGMVIALTQVPYTGFEAGKFLTFLFYAVLTLWAAFIAYVLVVKKGSILGFSLYKHAPGTILSDVAVSEADLENRKKVEALVAKYSNGTWK